MMVHELQNFLIFHADFLKKRKLLEKVVLKLFIKIIVVEHYCSPNHGDFYLRLSVQYLLSSLTSLVGVCKNALKTRQSRVANKSRTCLFNSNYSRTVIMQNTKNDCYANYTKIFVYIIIRVHSAFSLVASCVLLKYTRTDDVN